MSDTAVLDACCLINLAAADALDAWLGDIGPTWMLPQAVLAEALFLRRRGEPILEDGDSTPIEPTREAILLGPHAASGLLNVVKPETELELSAYVAFASALDDGEAMALTIAQSRCWQLATDDRKAIRMAGQVDVPVLTTPAIVRRWVEQLGPSARDVLAALIAIRDRARLLPGRHDPLYDWWMDWMEP